MKGLKPSWSVNLWGFADDGNALEKLVVEFTDLLEAHGLESGTLNMSDRRQIVFDPHSKLAIGREREE